MRHTMIHPNVFDYLTMSDNRILSANCADARAHVARREAVVAAFRHWRARTTQRRWTRSGLSVLRGRFPVLEFQDRFIGATCYLDGIACTDPPHPIMVGRDKHGRGFLTVRYKCEEDWVFDGETRKATPNAVHFLTLFQRYTDSCMWCKVSRPHHAHASPLLCGTSTSLSDGDLRLLVANLFRMQSNSPIHYMDYACRASQTPTVERTVRCVLGV